MFDNISITLDEQKYLELAEYIKDLSAKNDFLYGKYYKLLAYFSSTLPKDSIVFDVGTYRGISALALSYNEYIKVISFDIANFNIIYNRNNIVFKIGNFLEDENLLNASLMFIDVDPHDGIKEATFLDQLIKIGYKGILIFDDIHLNSGMDNFWKNATSYNSQDLTSLGHTTGTGLLIL